MLLIGPHAEFTTAACLSLERDLSHSEVGWLMKTRSSVGSIKEIAQTPREERKSNRAIQMLAYR